MTARKNEAILKHGLALQRIFPATKHLGPVTLYKRLHRLEAEAHSFAEKCCNESVADDVQERKDKSILKRLDAILGFKATGVPVFLNSDPRGYALKIKDSYVREHNLDISTDWGKYGIICPEF